MLARLGQYLLVLWVAATVNFVLPHLAPGDPTDYLAGELNGLNEANRERLRAEYDLDGPLVSQYGRYWRALLHGDLGHSIRHGRPVAAVIAGRLPWTVLLVGTAAVLSTLLGVMAGIAAALRRGRRRDVGLVFGLLTLDAMPGFWTGMILIAIFSSHLRWLPSFGSVALDSAGGLAWLGAVARRLVLPVMTIVLATVGATFLLTRASMLSVLDKPYMYMAEAKGLTPRAVIYHHALRNALLPVYTNLTLSLGLLLSGAVVVETVFSYPGIGRLVYEAVTARDYPVLRGAFLLITVGVVTANLIADLTYPLLDPRVRRVGRVRTG